MDIDMKDSRHRWRRSSTACRDAIRACGRWPRGCCARAGVTAAGGGPGLLRLLEGQFEELERRRAGRGQAARRLPGQDRAGGQPGALQAQQRAGRPVRRARCEKQLPSKAEMDALLSDINQAGLGRGLQFELFKPGQVRDQGVLRRAADRRSR